MSEVAGCAFRRKSRPIHIFLAIASLGAGLWHDMSTTGENAGIIWGGAAAVIFAILYFMSIKKVLVVASRGETQIEIPAKGLEVAKMIEFIDKLEQAKMSIRSA